MCTGRICEKDPRANGQAQDTRTGMNKRYRATHRAIPEPSELLGGSSVGKPLWLRIYQKPPRAQGKSTAGGTLRDERKRSSTT